MNALIVHIGLHKTGSGSVQQALNADHESLMEQGVYVPRTATRNYRYSHRNLAFELNGHPHFREDHGTMEDLYEELTTVELPKVIISAEGFSKLTKHSVRNEAKYKRLKNLAQVLSRRLVVVGFVREYASAINSAYCQRVKTFGTGLSFDEYLKQVLSLDRWTLSKMFAGYEAVADQVIVLPHVGDSVTALYRALDIEPAKQEYERINTSLGPLGIEAFRVFYRHYRDIFETGAGRSRDHKGGPTKLLRPLSDQLGWNVTPFWGFRPGNAAEVHQRFSERDSAFLRRHSCEFNTDFGSKQRNELFFEEMNPEQQHDFVNAMTSVLRALNYPIERWLTAPTATELQATDSHSTGLSRRKANKLGPEVLVSKASDTKVLVVHIGLHKTGSGSVQHALNTDHQLLVEQGVYVPKTATREYKLSHRNLSYELNAHRAFRPKDGTMKDLYEELVTVGLSKVIISAEGFSKLTDDSQRNEAKYRCFQDLARSLSRRLVVVGFVREYASAINAAYGQRIKRFSNARTFDEFLVEALGWDRWSLSKIFSGYESVADEMMVLPHGGHSVIDFYRSIGIEPPSTSYDRVNTGFGPRTVEACRILCRHYRDILRSDPKRPWKNKGAPATTVRAISDELGWNAARFWGFYPDVANAVHQRFADRDSAFIRRYGLNFDTDFIARDRNELPLEEMNAEQGRDFTSGMMRILQDLDFPPERWPNRIVV